MSGSKHGPLTVDGWNAHKTQTGEYLTVLVDGQDVTTRCTYADDITGEAHCFKLNTIGKKYLDGCGEPAKEVLHGTVEIVAGVAQ